MDVVADAVEGMRARLQILHDACDGLSHRELVALMAEVTTLVRSVPALEHQILARLTSETEPRRLGEASWKKVLTTTLRVSEREAKRRLADAASLGPRQALTGEPLAPLWEATAAAQAAGSLDVEHVAVIAKFHDGLPVWVDVDTRAAADRQLASLGAGLTPEDLREAADRLAAMIDQDGPEPTDADRARKRGIRLGEQQADGMSRLTGWVTPEFRAHYEAIQAKLAAPGMCNPDDETPCVDGEPAEQQRRDDTRSPAQRTHDAWLAVGRMALTSGELGQHNGLPVTVIVSTTLQDLEKGAGVAVTGGGSLLPMTDLIRMAAHAHPYLAVFDAHTSQPLYLGRSKRLASPAQRIVLHSSARGCTRPGCSVPGYWAQVHHVRDWKDGGATDITNLTLACGPDNRMVEQTGWTTKVNHRGQTEWLPPPDLDTGGRRTNGYHHPERHLLPEDDQGP
ncbi:HNH endonuclease signature motif containing protein [Mycobacterium sp. PSTR-4-N]|uniref:HNH endonuclease signature motif containing protein n=1 Tax=Mycobacterium sp. PSTR-4-N TaxID=2917745 RepID=UPI001F14A82B|nr:HNH endonuclease signature motif containing protein [Mycobacterium sp. PSTR-4-N]MCG7593018.1 HNH endonuclease [Mycobacterium sp. PSTR-4-N]